ncbi:MAG: hypothetical protein HY784_02740 [Chloroflexi bacterium]|nr:hypothetical protein [Chloroflexota bacterium]
MLKRFGPPLLIALGALLLAGAAGWGALSARLASPAALAVPEAIAGLPLAGKSTGPQAVAEVARLHGKGFLLTSGATATYGDGAATLWVTGTLAGPLAAEMVRAMTEKIAEGRSPFTPIATRGWKGRNVYELAGMGQRHFYFQSGALVVWLAAGQPLADRALDETLEFYP